MSMTPRDVTNVELPHTFRGFDESATRKHLAAVAFALESVLAECDRLRRQVESLQNADATNPNAAESIGAVLLTATRAADDLLAKAKEDAARLHQAAEHQCGELVARARAQADTQVANTTVKLASIRSEEQSLRAAIAGQRQELAAFLRSAVRQLDEFEGLAAGASGGHLDDQLLARIPSD